MQLKKAARILCLILTILSILPLFSCAITTSKETASFDTLDDYTKIPGITVDEIEAVKNIQANYDSFTVAMMPPNTELFYDENGELCGFSVMVCEWLTDIFEITFNPDFYDWPETVSGLADHSIDFTGEMTATPERREYMFMTDSIGERTIKAIRHVSSKKISESTAEHPVRCVFLSGTTAYDCVEPYISNIEVIFAESLSEVISMFDEGKIDVFVVDGSAEAVFDTDPSIVADDFSPIIFSPVSFSTQNPELAPIIDLVQKIIKSEYGRYFSEMYKNGYSDYLHRKLLLQFTPEEMEYIKNHRDAGIPIPFIIEFDNYPVSFFNERAGEWQGVSYDILSEIEKLTGLSFVPGVSPGTIWSDMLPMVRRGDIPMASELIYSTGRSDNYIWADEPYISDFYALLSTSEYPDVSVSEITNSRVALVKDSAYAEFFYERFPDHKDIIEYPSVFAAVSALEKGEVDLLMATKNILLAITNYLEKPGFKTNLVFMRASESFYGFNKDEVILRSIVSKAQRLVDTRSIVDRWQRTVFDYKSALARERVPFWIGLVVLVLLIISLLLILVIRSRRVSALLEATVHERTKELETQTNTNRVILDSNPFFSVMFDEELNILDCNLSAKKFFNIQDLSGAKSILLRKLSDMIPEYQPNGQVSFTLNDRIVTTLAEGFCEFETNFVTPERTMYFHVVMKKITYNNKDAIVTYMFDLTSQKEAQFKLKYHGNMLETISDVANMLLVTDVKDFDKTMTTALDAIGHAAMVDRVYIWKNHTGEDGENYSSQLYEWAKDDSKVPNVEPEQNINVNSKTAVWHETLRNGESVSVLIKDTEPIERAILEERNIISLLMVPIFLQGKCWGFIGFDDCHTERVFSKTEENILRICGFMAMVISDTIQNEVATHLLAEREAALISAQIKTNFLANMSHEIRTPMNAIQGMTELIMHESINDTVLSHATDIRNACRGLLLIINDILDISKIESGKLEIVPTRYHISSLLMDVISIIKTRTDKKDIAFLVNIDPRIPGELIGDEQRIKQILINLLNNAVKFTNDGKITLSISCEIENDACKLTFSVSDTGIGIKEEDMDKVFVLFQQINTKKNRNIEGTGLGLSISKQLAEMMGGSIEMDSEYGVGSTFTMAITQPIADSRPLASLKYPERSSVLIYESRPTYLDSVTYTLDSLGCSYRICSNRTEMHNLLEEFECDYIFISSLSVNKVQDIAELKRPNAAIVVLNGDGNTYYKSNVISISMPIHCLQLANILNDEYLSFDTRSSASHSTNIIAPSAKVLVVDDNAVNLKVAAGLLNIYKIQVDTASGGMHAIEMVSETDYDIVFMDHMMPDMDGIDTTVAIRSMGKKYEALPIIALTANAIGGMRDMFRAEGLNDFLPKPIEMSRLNTILKRWLPADKQQARDVEIVLESPYFEIPGIDTRKGMRNSGGAFADYNDILAVYAADCGSRLPEMAKYYRSGNMHSLAICVHAIKSASANIGADDVSGMAAELEAACKTDDIVYVDANLRRFTDSLTTMLDDILNYLSSIPKNDAGQTKSADLDFLKFALTEIERHMDSLDIDAAEHMLVELCAYGWNDSVFEWISKIKYCIGIFDYDGITSAVAQLKMICGFDA